MKVFGFSRNGFLYIDNGNSLISQQVTSGESEMLNRYSSEWEYKNYDDALATFNHHKPKPKLGNIERNFAEEMFAGSDWLEEEENQLW